MFNFSNTMFSFDKDLPKLYGQLNKLNSDVIADRIILNANDLQSSEDYAKKFLWQHSNKNGPLYENIMARQENWYARHIHALAVNIEAKMYVQSIMSKSEYTPPTTMRSTSSKM